MRRGRLHGKTGPVVVALLLAPTALAQDAAQRERLARILGEGARPLVLPDAPGTTLSERLYVDLGLSLRQAFLNVNNADSTSLRLWQTQGELYAHMSYAGAHQALVRLNFDYRDYSDGDALSSTQGQGQLAEPIVAAAWYRFDLAAAQRLAGVAESELTGRLTLGRQRASIGSGLVLDNDLDGAAAEMTRGDLSLTLIAGITPERSTIDFDGSRPDFDTSTLREVLAAQARWEPSSAWQAYVFALTQIDENETRRAVIDVSGIAVPTEFKYDTHYVGIGASGALSESWVWAAEAVHEWGRGKSNPYDYDTGIVEDPTMDDVSAWAGVTSLTHLFNDAGDSKAHLWVMAGSGDEDRLSGNQTLGGNARNTTDHAFNAFGYVPTGYVLAPDLANLIVVRLGAATRLWADTSRPMRFGADAYLFSKLDPDAGATVETKRGERFVGAELDFLASWQIGPDVTLDIRYGLFLPGEATLDEHDDVRHLIYVGVGYAF